jgi:hypothetical protein
MKLYYSCSCRESNGGLSETISGPESPSFPGLPDEPIGEWPVMPVFQYFIVDEQEMLFVVSSGKRPSGQHFSDVLNAEGFFIAPR